MNSKRELRPLKRRREEKTNQLFECVPWEIWEMIFSYMTVKSLFVCRATCKLWQDAIDELCYPIWSRHFDMLPLTLPEDMYPGPEKYLTYTFQNHFCPFFGVSDSINTWLVNGQYNLINTYLASVYCILTEREDTFTFDLIKCQSSFGLVHQIYVSSTYSNMELGIIYPSNNDVVELLCVSANGEYTIEITKEQILKAWNFAKKRCAPGNPKIELF